MSESEKLNEFMNRLDKSVVENLDAYLNIKNYEINRDQESRDRERYRDELKQQLRQEHNWDKQQEHWESIQDHYKSQEKHWRNMRYYWTGVLSLALITILVRLINGPFV